MATPSFESVESPSHEAQVADAARGVKNATIPTGSLAVGIDRRENLSYDEFIESYVKRNLPVIIKNAFPEWGAMGKWTPEYLKEKAGHRTVVVDGKDISLGEHLENCMKSTFEKPSAYMREQVIRHVAPELAEDLMPFCQYALPNWLRGYYPVVDGLLNRAGEVELFIGGQGARLLRRKADTVGGGDEYGGTGGQFVAGFADLHYDPTALPVMLFQVYGRKEWVVFAPEDTPYLYARGRLSAIKTPDLPDPRFPLFAKATPIRFIQEPGEAAFIPAFWWHATRMLTLSIAVSSTFANAHHWEGMIDDVVENFAKGNLARAMLIRTYLRAVAKKKEQGGRTVGDHPFEEHKLRKALGPVKRTVRSLLKRS